MTKVYCGEEQVATQALQGLSRITLRRDCRLVHDYFVLEPTIDFGDQDNELSEIPLTFDNDLNMSQVLVWGYETGLLRPSDQGNALTMLELPLWHLWYVAAVLANAGIYTCELSSGGP